MSATWEEPADVLLEHAPPDWHGLWTLLYAAGHATHTLALTASAMESLELTVAAMDLHQAREELERVHPEVANEAPAISLGLLPAREHFDSARAVVERLVVAVLDRMVGLAPTGDLGTPGGTALVSATGALRSARSVLSRR